MRLLPISRLKLVMWLVRELTVKFPAVEFHSDELSRVPSLGVVWRRIPGYD